jgi:hypothetical protein
MGYSYAVAASAHSVILELRGSKAKRGVDLDGFEGFIEHFRRALREFERWLSAHEEEIGRSGQPRSRTRRATGFRLVAFREGSGIATLEPLETPDEESQIMEDEPPSLRNLSLMMDAVQQRRPLATPVIESLDGARKSLGTNGRFGSRAPEEERVHFWVDEDAIRNLESEPEPEPEAKELVVTGKLHLLEFEQPMRVEVRAPTGVNWVCTYEPEMEQLVVSFAGQNVRARGIGRITGPKRGEMELLDLDPVLLPAEQPSLFTIEPIPTEELQREQGIVRPQGLAALQDPTWVDDDASREYVAILDEA